MGEQSFVQYLAIIKIYKEPIFQLFLNQRMIGSGSLGEGAFRIIEPPVLVIFCNNRLNIFVLHFECKTL